MKNKLTILTIIGLILGIIGGLYLPSVMNEISFLGTIYVNLLKFMIIPIIFTSIMSTIYKSNKEKSRLLIKTVLLFIIMFVISFLITSGIVALVKPGTNYIFDEVIWTGEVTSLKIQDILVNLFPNNIITMISGNMIFATILFAFVSGVAASKVPNGKIVVDFVDATKEIFYKILEYIMYLTPLGVLSLVGSTIATYGTTIIGVGAKYILLAYICSIVVMVVVMILPVCIFAKINSVDYVRKVSKVWLMTLTTCSSAATLPTTIKVCNEEFGIPNKITDIVVPLGCTIHMCGGAVSFALLGLFTSQLYGVAITLPLFLQMIFTSTIINMAAPGIPNGGIVIGATYLSILGIPLSFIGFYSGIYKLLDMSYTTLNVTGDITANILLSNNILTKEDIKQYKKKK